MATPRKPTPPTTAAVDQFCSQFDPLFNRRAARDAFRRYLMALLLPREHNKALTVLAALVPGTTRQRLHHFLHAAPWDAGALNRQRLALWQAHPTLAPHGGGVLIVDETGDPKRGHAIELAGNQYLGKLGHTANGVVSVTSQWADGTRQVPLGVRAYWPASRLPRGKKDPRFHTRPDLAWELIEEARGAGIPFALVVADCAYGENPTLEERLWAARIRYVLAIRPSHGTWQVVEDEANPPAFTPQDAAQRLPLDRWQPTIQHDSHGRELLRYVAELELPPYYGPERPTRLIAASADPATLKPDATWYMTTTLPLAEATAIQVYERYRLRDWIEHYYKPVNHELGWAGSQVRPARAIVRHWQRVMLAYTFSLLQEALPPPEAVVGLAPPTGSGRGGEITAAPHLARQPARGPRLAVPLGVPAALLAPVVARAAPAGAGGPARARRAVAPAPSPDLTNQRLSGPSGKCAVYLRGGANNERCGGQGHGTPGTCGEQGGRGGDQAAGGEPHGAGPPGGAGPDPPARAGGGAGARYRGGRGDQPADRPGLDQALQRGLDGLKDAERSGRPATYPADQVGEMVAASLTKPEELGLPFASWTLDRLVAYLAEAKSIGIKRSRLDEILIAEGLRWRTQETWFGARVDPDFAQKRGRSRPSTPSRLRVVS